MAHPILFGLLGAFIVSRLVLRGHRRHWRHAHGCGRFGDGPIDLGAPDSRGAPDLERRFGRFGRRWQRWQRHARAEVASAPPPANLAGSLELNQRQRELFDEVLDKAKRTLHAPELAEALGLLGREPFDRPALEFLVGHGELADDLEQLHFSLTTEQRGKLRTVAGA
jgi:hypothetical protein